MGTEITKEDFDERDYARFRERLEQNLSELRRLLDRPGFGAGPVTIGAELELFLVDPAARPLPLNQAVRAQAADPRITVELNRFDLELNSSPVPLSGPSSRPFAALGGELGLLLARVGAAARAHQGRTALIGVLPTLSQAHLGAGVVTDAARYRAHVSRSPAVGRDQDRAVQAVGRRPRPTRAEARTVSYRVRHRLAAERGG